LASGKAVEISISAEEKLSPKRVLETGGPIERVIQRTEIIV